MERQVTIEQYNPSWPVQFQKERRLLLTLFGDKVLDIEHIGSTSVEGLWAKPILDIMVGVENLETIGQFIDPLNCIGYEFVDHRHFPDRRFFRKGPWRAGTHHLHVYKYKGQQWNDQIWFREYLKNHSETSREYCELKMKLAQQFRFDRGRYTAQKASFIQEVLKNARLLYGDF
jgi:GrpB-like predicted nucleotidyltransferase (UPF0157 family)